LFPRIQGGGRGIVLESEIAIAAPGIEKAVSGGFQHRVVDPIMRDLMSAETSGIDVDARARAIVDGVVADGRPRSDSPGFG
jgi:hypothetical protein